MKQRMSVAAALISGVLAVALAACGSSGSSGSSASTTTASTAKTVVVSDAWARATALGVPQAAVYLRVTSPVGDQLVGAAVPSSVGMDAMLHDTTMNDNMASMREMKSVALPAGKVVVFQPGGMHIMVTGLTHPLSAGQHFTLTLHFAHAPDAMTTVSVRPAAS